MTADEENNLWKSLTIFCFNIRGDCVQKRSRAAYSGKYDLKNREFYLIPVKKVCAYIRRNDLKCTGNRSFNF